MKPGRAQGHRPPHSVQTRWRSRCAPSATAARRMQTPSHQAVAAHCRGRVSASILRAEGHAASAMAHADRQKRCSRQSPTQAARLPVPADASDEQGGWRTRSGSSEQELTSTGGAVRRWPGSARNILHRNGLGLREKGHLATSTGTSAPSAEPRGRAGSAAEAASVADAEARRTGTRFGTAALISRSKSTDERRACLGPPGGRVSSIRHTVHWRWPETRSEWPDAVGSASLWPWATTSRRGGHASRRWLLRRPAQTTFPSTTPAARLLVESRAIFPPRLRPGQGAPAALGPAGTRTTRRSAPRALVQLTAGERLTVCDPTSRPRGSWWSWPATAWSTSSLRGFAVSESHAWAQRRGARRLLLEDFYRDVRRLHGLLLDERSNPRAVAGSSSEQPAAAAEAGPRSPRGDQPQTLVAGGGRRRPAGPGPTTRAPRGWRRPRASCARWWAGAIRVGASTGTRRRGERQPTQHSGARADPRLAELDRGRGAPTAWRAPSREDGWTHHIQRHGAGQLGPAARLPSAAPASAVLHQRLRSW